MRLLWDIFNNWVWLNEADGLKTTISIDFSWNLECSWRNKVVISSWVQLSVTRDMYSKCSSSCIEKLICDWDIVSVTCAVRLIKDTTNTLMQFYNFITIKIKIQLNFSILEICKANFDCLKTTWSSCHVHLFWSNLNSLTIS